MLAVSIEWLAFSASLCSVWLYGRKGLWGPVAGTFTALLFFAFGFAAEVYAAVFANAVFLTLHIRNGWKIMQSDPRRTAAKIASAFSLIQDRAHQASLDAGWWTDDKRRTLILQPDGQWKEIALHEDPFVIASKLMLQVSEIVEAMEGHRKGLQDDKLPHRLMIEVELADAVIRIADLAGVLNLDVGGAIAEKMAFNEIRPDHKPENRAKAGWKVY